MTRIKIPIVVLLSSLGVARPIFAAANKNAEAVEFAEKAVRAWDGRRWTEANRNAQMAIEDDPALSEALWIKALLLAQTADVSAARSMVARANAGHSRLDAKTATRLRSAADAALQPMELQTTPHFRVASSAQATTQGAGEFGAEMEKHFSEFAAAFGTPKLPINATLYGPSTFWLDWKTPVWWSGFFDPRNGEIRWRNDAVPGGISGAEKRLRHQLAHVFLHASSSVPIPLWFDEGIAAAWETPSSQWPARVDEVRHFLEGAPSMNPERLEEILKTKAAAPAELEIAERGCEAAVLELLIRSPKLLSTLIAELKAGRFFDDALTAAGR